MAISEYRTDEHYSQLKILWEKHGWEAPLPDVLPRKGFVETVDGKVVAGAFIYRSCSLMMLLDWVVSDPEANPFTSGKAVFKVVGACKAYAIKEGFKVIYTITGNKKLSSMYERIGFSVMEKDAVSMALSLDGYELDFLKE